MEFNELRDHTRVLERLREGFAGELPGERGQAVMSPAPRHGWTPGRVPDGLRQAAALLLVYSRHGTPHVLLTQRRADLSAHAGQVSMPGGAIDPGESPEQAALREADEEVGLDPGRVGVVGRLTPLHIPASGFVLHTVVGQATETGVLVPSDTEVARVLEVPIEELARPGRLEVERWRLRGSATTVPLFRVEGLAIWGATAMILGEFLALLGHPPRPPRTPARDSEGGTLPGSESATDPQPGDTDPGA